MSCHRAHQRTIPHAPDPDVVVIASADQPLPIRAERDGSDPFGVGEGAYELVIGHSSQLYRAVGTARGEHLAIRSKRDLPPDRGVAAEGVVQMGPQRGSLGGTQRRKTQTKHRCGPADVQDRFPVHRAYYGRGAGWFRRVSLVRGGSSIFRIPNSCVTSSTTPMTTFWVRSSASRLRS